VVCPVWIPVIRRRCFKYPLPAGNSRPGAKIESDCLQPIAAVRLFIDSTAQSGPVSVHEQGIASLRIGPAAH